MFEAPEERKVRPIYAQEVRESIERGLAIIQEERRKIVAPIWEAFERIKKQEKK